MPGVEAFGKFARLDGLRGLGYLGRIAATSVSSRLNPFDAAAPDAARRLTRHDRHRVPER